MHPIFDALKSGNYAALQQLMGRAEALDFDCKQKADRSKSQLELKDKQILGKTLSAFANSMGGLLLWGVDARKVADDKPDEIFEFKSIANIRTFESEIRNVAADALMPRLRDIETLVIEDPSNTNAGYLAVYVERSESRPHRCEISGVKGYYQRAIASTRMMEHFEIEDAFKRASVPELRIRLSVYSGPTSSVIGAEAATIGVEISLGNISATSAFFPYVGVEKGGSLRWDANRPLGTGINQRVESGVIYFEGDANIVIQPDTWRVFGRVVFNVPCSQIDGRIRRVSRNALPDKTVRVIFGCHDLRQKSYSKNFTSEELIEGVAGGVLV